MEPGSGWLQRFASVPLCVPGISVRTSHDNVVMPQERQRLAGMEDIELPAIGHLSLLYSRRTTDLLLESAVPSLTLLNRSSTVIPNKTGA